MTSPRRPPGGGEPQVELEVGKPVRHHASGFGEESAPPSSRRSQPWPPQTYARSEAPPGLSTLRAKLGGWPGGGSGGAPVATATVEDDLMATENDSPTNVFDLALYRYQLSISAISMADAELAVLLPRSGHIWFNASLFKRAPRGRETAQHDAWLHAVDTSGEIRFLLAWSLALYSTAHFRGVPHEDLPGWSRMIAYGPRLADCPRNRLEHWSDVTQEVTRLLAPPPRIWRQLQRHATIRMGDPQWRVALAKRDRVVEDIVGILADRNLCPATIIRRTLDGNPRFNSYAEYLAFTEALRTDLPQLRSQRFLAIYGRDGEERNTPPPKGQGRARSRGRSGMDDPRQAADFWQLHL